MSKIPTVYVASSLFNAEEAKSIISRFRSKGVQITYDWTTHGKITDTEQLAIAGRDEANGVIDADLLFMKQPARTGAHIEMGIAIGLNMYKAKKLPIILVKDGNSEEKTFYYLDCVTSFTDLDEAFEKALELLGVRT